LVASLAVFLSVARGKVSVPQVVTPSYTQDYHAALLCYPSITYLVLRCPSCSFPCNVLRPMPASVFWVPFPATSGGDGTAGNLKMSKSDIH
ncbi:unnamed protein product, partial [Staurois parvus]